MLTQPLHGFCTLAMHNLPVSPLAESSSIPRYRSLYLKRTSNQPSPPQLVSHTSQQSDHEREHRDFPHLDTDSHRNWSHRLAFLHACAALYQGAERVAVAVIGSLSGYLPTVVVMSDRAGSQRNEIVEAASLCIAATILARRIALDVSVMIGPGYRVVVGTSSSSAIATSDHYPSSSTMNGLPSDQAICCRGVLASDTTNW